MHALSRPFPRRVLFVLSTVLVIAGMLAVPLDPLVQTIRADSRPVGQWASTPRQEAPPMAESAALPENNNGLTIRLSEGAQETQAVEAVPVAEAQPLTDAEVQLVLDRLPPLETEAADQQVLNLPTASLPPPKPGETITTTFPPAESVPAPSAEPSGALEVLRYAPEGEIPDCALCQPDLQPAHGAAGDVG